MRASSWLRRLQSHIRRPSDSDFESPRNIKERYDLSFLSEEMRQVRPEDLLENSCFYYNAKYGIAPVALTNICFEKNYIDTPLELAPDFWLGHMAKCYTWKPSAHFPKRGDKRYVDCYKKLDVYFKYLSEYGGASASLFYKDPLPPESERFCQVGVIGSLLQKYAQSDEYYCCLYGESDKWDSEE